MTELAELVFWVSPKNIHYCTPSSTYADLNHHEKDRDHPHAFYDRGYFYEMERKGQILPGDWDHHANLNFTNLLEYQSLYNHLKGIERWALSKFAKRLINYMLMDNKESAGARYRYHGFDGHPDEFIAERERQIVSLIRNIKVQGVIPAGGVDCQASNPDDISVNISRKGKLLFNNRGHHRLSIAKILNIKLVPVQIIVWHPDNFI